MTSLVSSGRADDDLATLRARAAALSRLRVSRRIARLEAQLSAYDSELKSIAASPLAQLKAMVDEAASRGRDLIAENVRRLNRDIIAARNRLDAIRWNP